MKTHNIYRTENLVNGKYYWGVHDSIDESDGYLGSGAVLRKAIKKYGKDAFRRKTMATYETAEAAYFDEGLVVNQETIDDPLCYNLRPGGRGGSVKGSKRSNETRRRIGVSRAYPLGENHQMFGKHHSEESKKKNSIANKGKARSNETKLKQSAAKIGKISNSKGKLRSAETKAKISLAGSDGRNKGQNNPNSKTNREKRFNNAA